MNGYITAKQKWVADRPFKAGQPLKYRRTIGGLSKDYVLVAKYTDAIPEMWPAWFENVYPNTWFLPSNVVSSTQIWPGDTIVDFGTGQKYFNSTDKVVYSGELVLPDSQGTALKSLVVIPFDKTQVVKISPYYNGDYEETEHIIYSNYGNVRNYNIFLYKVLDSVNLVVKVTGIAPVIYPTINVRHSLVINYLDYSSISFSGISPDSTTVASCTYLFNNTIADYLLTITNSSGVITIHRENA